MQLNSLEMLYVDKLKDLYSAEQQIVEALPKMAEAASAKELKQGFQKHLKQSQQQAKRIEKIFKGMGEQPSGKTCEAMKGLIKEGQEIIKMKGDPVVKDVALIGAAQAIEHYEIAGYGTARSIAAQLGFGDVADLLQETLDEEWQMNEQLNHLALGDNGKPGMNEEAVTVEA